MDDFEHRKSSYLSRPIFCNFKSNFNHRTFKTNNTTLKIKIEIFILILTFLVLIQNIRMNPGLNTNNVWRNKIITAILRLIWNHI